MDDQVKSVIQNRVSCINTIHIKELHTFHEVPKSFHPWESGLSPSALYGCSLTCRKKMRLKTPEVKWMSIKRWVTQTSSGIDLPTGVYLSVKRREKFVTEPSPHLEKKEFTLLMFPYGNVWSQKEPDAPIDEEWLFSDTDGMLIIEHLLRRDAAFPVKGYFESCYKYMSENPDQIGIHLKRKKPQSGEV